jgi:hypothetical protein
MASPGSLSCPAMKRACVRPGCDRPAVATMSYDYAGRSVWISAIDDEPNPHTYGLCSPCAERLSAPRGWTLTDSRARPLFEAAV